jgi:hypothetical protein
MLKITKNKIKIILLFITETALLLLTLDKSLSELKDSEGKTSLGLLAEIPSAFKSGDSMNIFTRDLYMCMF